jgi:hypothetical protein
MAATAFSYTPPGLWASHPTRKWVVQTGPSGDVISKNVGNGPAGPGSQMTVVLAPGEVSPGGATSLGGGSYTYDWFQTVDTAGAISIAKGAVCANPLLGYDQGVCAGDPCDLTLTGEHIQPYPGFTSGTDLGDPYVSGTVTYSRSGPITAGFTDLCGQSSPYTGNGANCDAVFGGCTISRPPAPTPSSPQASTTTTRPRTTLGRVAVGGDHHHHGGRPADDVRSHLPAAQHGGHSGPGVESWPPAAVESAR